MSALVDLVRRGWRRVVLSVRRRRRTPVRAVALAAFCLIVATLVLVTVLGLDAGRGGVLFACLVALFTIATVLRPEGVAATVVLVLLVAGYLYGTALAGIRPEPLPVLALAVALYVAHALVALAAAVPPGATVETAVLRRWLRRLGEVLVACVPLGLLLPLFQHADDLAAIRVLGYVVIVAFVAVAVAYARGRAPWRD
jgi:hypothetical protein